MSDMEISSADAAENLPPDSYDTGANMGAPSATNEKENNFHDKSVEKSTKSGKDERSPSKSKDYGRDRERNDRDRDREREERDKSRRKR